jgi:putative restriction endonuclease
MKLYVGVTDNDWYRFLRSRPDLEEVNFRQPGDSGNGSTGSRAICL